MIDLYTAFPALAAPAFDTGEIAAITVAHNDANGHHVYLSSTMDPPYIDAFFALLPPPPAHEVTDDATPGTRVPGHAGCRTRCRRARGVSRRHARARANRPAATCWMAARRGRARTRQPARLPRHRRQCWNPSTGSADRAGLGRWRDLRSGPAVDPAIQRRDSDDRHGERKHRESELRHEADEEADGAPTAAIVTLFCTPASAASDSASPPHATAAASSAYTVSPTIGVPRANSFVRDRPTWLGPDCNRPSCPSSGLS